MADAVGYMLPPLRGWSAAQAPCRMRLHLIQFPTERCAGEEIMPAKRVLSVGQCGADHPAISRMLRQHFDTEVEPADTFDEALRKLRQESFSLVLVNRVLDADGSSGMELIRQIKADVALGTVPMMLVSNYDHYQEEAMKEGAVKGFGKGALGQPQTIARL